MSAFEFHKMFPLGHHDEVPYRKLTSDHVEATSFAGQPVVKVRPEALMLLAKTAFRDVSHLLRTGQQWRNLEGYYTRYGDVGPLLGRVDNRIVIMNSGDELRMRFQVPARQFRSFPLQGFS